MVEIHTFVADLMGLGTEYGIILIKIQEIQVMRKQKLDLEQIINKKEDERKQLEEVIKLAAANVIRALPFQFEIELYLMFYPNTFVV